MTIKKIRVIDLDMNQDKFAKKLTITQSTVSRHEKGEVIPPGDILFKIAKLGKTTMEKILDLVPSIPKERQIDLKEAGLNERQINALKLMINENEKITIKKYVNLFKVSDKTAKRDLKGLVESDFVIKKGVKKGAYFEAK